jgi:tetratricopeptide (TPR) repeat protein
MPARLLLAVLLAALPRLARADVSARVVLDPPRVTVGESTDLAVEVRGTQEATAPNLPSVEGLAIRYVGPSTEVSIVNGAMTASVTHHFTVVAARAGTFALGPVIVEVGGRQVSAGTATLTVAPGGAANNQVRLVLTASKSEVYVRERVPVTLKLFIGDVRVADLQYPTVPGDGFALEKFPQPEQRTEQTAEGSFHVVEFTSTLTPLRSGPLSVGPAAMGLSLIVGGQGADPFFGHRFGQRKPLEVRAEPLVLTVLPLPDADRPADFSGAVGHFELDVRAAPVNVAAGDPVTVTATIRGDGSLEGVPPPALPATDALRVYPVQSASGSPTTDAHVFEQVVIPRRAGTTTLPELRFSYFDPDARAYRTAVRPGIALTVRPSPNAEAAPTVAAKPAPGPEVVGHDLVFIKDGPGRLRPLGARLYRSPVFWAVQAIPLLLWVAAVLYDHRRRRLAGDVRYARYTRAGRAARRELTHARSALQATDGARFYDAVACAIRDYLSAKLDLPPGAVTPDTVTLRLAAAGLPAATADEVEGLFAACERARFAPPGDGRPDMERTLARAEALVRTLERTRRLGPAALVCLLLGVGALAAAAGDTPLTMFFRGNTLYGEERYAAAAAEYERVLASGQESGNLYFNLGNAYWKANEPGQAILAWERARRLSPRDPDVRANLAHARPAGEDEPDAPLHARLLFPLASRLGSDEAWLATSAAWTVLMLCLVVGRLAPAAARAARGVALAATITVLVVGSGALYRLVTTDLPPHGVVVAAGETPVRFEPADGGTVHFQAALGTVVRVLGEREGWAQVARPDGRRGWIARAALALL